MENNGAALSSVKNKHNASTTIYDIAFYTMSIFFFFHNNLNFILRKIKKLTDRWDA